MSFNWVFLFSVVSFGEQAFIHDRNIQHLKKNVVRVYVKSKKEKGGREHKHSCLALGLIVYPTWI